ncbi:MAG TPA: ABC transporter permease, partial [Anaeromyxobacteraceae bacterium]|nr:ABC transporter permease [Anaeromyxobacteraceae bacterium]
MYRTWAIIERELRRFRRSPVLMIVSMVFPLVQLVVLGYAFGGNVKGLKVGVVDQDRSVPAVRLRELSGAVAANARTLEPILYHDRGQALSDLREGRLNGVLAIPPDFSRRACAKEDPRVALIEDNTDNFVANTLATTFTGLVEAYNARSPSSGRV